MQLNAVVQILVGDEKKEATIQKINDHSWYTVGKILSSCVSFSF